jgi:hypothetical protein
VTIDFPEHSQAIIAFLNLFSDAPFTPSIAWRSLPLAKQQKLLDFDDFLYQKTVAKH